MAGKLLSLRGGGGGGGSGDHSKSSDLRSYANCPPWARATASAGPRHSAASGEEQQRRHCKSARSHVRAAASAAAAFIASHSFGQAPMAEASAAASAAATTSAMQADLGPTMFMEPNRSSAIDDVRSEILYIFMGTVFLSFFLILPGIRNDKLPTFLCITTSLLVACFTLMGLLGTTWHVGEAPGMSAAYKAHSRDRIQGELIVKIGLSSVNITLRAHKYFIVHEMDGPMVLMDARMTMGSDGTLQSRRSPGLLASLMPVMPVGTMRTEAEEHMMMAAPQSSLGAGRQSQLQPQQVNGDNNTGSAESFIPKASVQDSADSLSLADELLSGRSADGHAVDTELDSDEASYGVESAGRLARSSPGNSSRSLRDRAKRDSGQANATTTTTTSAPKPALRYTIKRVNHVDINFNERFYWIGPEQMGEEYRRALERGLPYPILTVAGYLSQDDAGFNWSRQYRLAGYYTSILLWLSVGLCGLMFCLHCAAPKYGIYAMQLLGCLLLSTNLTYSTLVPRGDRRLVIPFEGHALTFEFGPSYWLVLAGGKHFASLICSNVSILLSEILTLIIALSPSRSICLQPLHSTGCIALVVGTLIVLTDCLFPNFIFTTVLDVDYDSHQDYYMRQKYLQAKRRAAGDNSESSSISNGATSQHARPEMPEFLMKKKSIVTGRRSIPGQKEGEQRQTIVNKIESDTTATSEKIADRGQLVQRPSGQWPVQDLSKQHRAHKPESSINDNLIQASQQAESTTAIFIDTQRMETIRL